MKSHPRELIELAREPDGLSATERAQVTEHLRSCPTCGAYAEELERNDALLSLREPRVAPPPMRRPSRFGIGWMPLATATLVAVVVVTALGIAREAATNPALSQASPSLAASATPSSSALGSPTPAATSSASPSPDPTPVATPGGSGLGTLRGNWLFVGKFVPSETLPQAQVEIWGLPLESGTPKLVFAYTVGTAGIPEATFDNTPYLRRQFSPDGTKLVLSIRGQLTIVDLASGQSRLLGVTGKFPSWSKDGSQIAFLAEKPVQPSQVALSVVSAVGGTPRELGIVGVPSRSAEWSPDGSLLLASSQNGTAVIEVASGRVLRQFAAVAGGGASYVQWRATQPQLALAGYGCDRGNVTLVALDDAQAPARTLFDGGAGCDRADVRDPRWNPANPTEVLFVTTQMTPGTMPFGYRLRILDAATGQSSDVGVNAYEATWTWDGASVAYLAKAPAVTAYGSAVILRSRAGSTERELLRASGDDSFFSIASVAY